MAKKKEESSVIPAETRAGYHVSDTPTAGGRKSVDTNDGMAKELRGLDEDGLRKFAKKEGGDELVTRFNNWLKINLGMARMNLGNVVRGMRRNKDKPVKVKKAAKKAVKKTAKKAAKKAA